MHPCRNGAGISGRIHRGLHHAKPIRQFVWVLVAWAATAAGAYAQDTGAISSGNWDDPTIWTRVTVPS